MSSIEYYSQNLIPLLKKFEAEYSELFENYELI